MSLSVEVSREHSADLPATTRNDNTEESLHRSSSAHIMGSSL
jgi:hypothetical protein